MPVGGAVDMIQRPALDKQPVVTVETYVRPGHIPDNLQPSAARFTFIVAVDFLNRKKLRVGRFLTEFNSGKRIFMYPVVGDAAVRDFLQRLHIADKRVLAEVLLCFEIHLVGADYLAGKIRQGQVGHIVFLLYHFAEVTLHRLVASDGNLHKVLAD